MSKTVCFTQQCFENDYDNGFLKKPSDTICSLGAIFKNRYMAFQQLTYLNTRNIILHLSKFSKISRCGLTALDVRQDQEESLLNTSLEV